MKRIGAMLILVAGINLNGAGAGALRRGLQTTAGSLRSGSSLATFTPSASLPGVSSGSLLQPQSTFLSRLQTLPGARVYSQSITGQAAAASAGGAQADGGRYSARQVAALVLGLAGGATALDQFAPQWVKGEETTRLYDTYAASYGSVPRFLQRRDKVTAGLSQEKAVDFAKLIASVKGADIATMFADPSTLASISMIVDKDPQAAKIVATKFAKEMRRGRLELCCSGPQQRLFRQFIDADTDGANAAMLAHNLSVSNMTPLLDSENKIAKTTQWQGGWWSGQYMVVGEDQAAAKKSLLRSLAAKNPQAAEDITDVLLDFKLRWLTGEIPFYTIAFLVDSSPYAAEAIAKKLMMIPPILFQTMVKKQNIAPEVADELLQKLQAKMAELESPSRVQE